MDKQNENQNGNQEFVDFIVTARKYKTKLTNKYLARQKWEQFNPGYVKSFLPGTVIKLKVKPKQKVKEGELLMIHDAMKMLNRVVSPITGVVKAIHVTEGQKIPKNFLMIEIEPK
ncbi:MAG: acetyl-CoA carboxylase biotin carboxyl carrier protein subunit [Candidatus Azobacteroides sp.]|jgi:biotin carboxyl carrier protein|nr:acetyl-CoA carboxylase biotin carboxyl carrier protein subunit [Candidatus Azobacteroides sp.]